MSLKPMHNTVIIKADPIEKHKGLLVMPDRNMEEKRSPYGTIVSIGSDCDQNLTVGDRIMYRALESTPLWVKSNGEKLRVIKNHEVLAIVHD